MTMDRLRAVIFLSHMSRNRGSVWAEQRGGLQTNEAPSWAKIRRCTPSNHALLASTHLDGSICRVGTVWKGSTGGWTCLELLLSAFDALGSCSNPQPCLGASLICLSPSCSLFISISLSPAVWSWAQNPSSKHSLSWRLANLCAISVFYFPPLPLWCLHVQV